MRISAKSSVPLIALSALAGVAQAEDVLHSQRLAKRGIDAEGNYNISFFHVNDVHAHLDEFSSSGTDCTRPERGCYGGYARIKHTIDEQRPNYNDSLWLNVGDEFQGTMFYSYYGGEKIAETINQLNFSAMTIGNHEFDGGEEKLGDFLEKLNFPIVSANIHSQNEKLNKTIKPYHIFEEQGLALIGVTTETTPSISSPDDSTIFSDAVEAVQNAINEIKATTNITRIAAITHIGYDKDQELAAATTGLQLIMGGHSHTLLGDMEDAEGKYPTITKNKDGEEVFIVTAYRWGEYVGYIDVTYDAQGKILAYHGAPIHMTNTTEQDAKLQDEIEEWRVPFEKFAAEVVGQSNVELDQTTCQKKECLLGDFMADAMLTYRKNISDNVDFALINAGGIRATIDVGEITRGEVLTSFPFGNSIVEIKLKGEELWKVLEGIVTGINLNNNEEVTSFFQVSTGIKVQYNPENANNSKLVSVTIGDKELDNSTEYNIVTLDFLAGGGDNIFTPTTDFVSLDTQDVVLTQYVQAKSPVDIKLDGRIEVVNGTNEATPSATPSGSASPSGTGAPAQATTAGAVGRASGALGAGMLAMMAGVLFM
ncbi:Metallo-dependent phosphatase [Melanomma pulvis-pyrius CBS 109.77]|uniref:Metallo-dependent phosphatase n=1 Tax=Melanomma pulvis-pyrius CBS 109.77 TaxID=1314802 RepID=A0A6A6XCS8_9PLEO|nr:Metallo-dependent phosphatase [Melanomma pulvis-pyrius CBS 109.77]